jgi:glycine cleavage system H protein
MPVGGEVLSVNKALEDSPELVNKQPYGSGWMIEIKPSDTAELKGLMARDAYLSLLKGMSR